MKIKKELSLYIHIPFCIKKCNYCDFLSFVYDENKISAYIDILSKEIISYSNLKEEYEVTTIFFGGGTPSILEPLQLEYIINALKKSFDINDAAEITIECNPGTLTKEKLFCYKNLGINRLSIGLQSTSDEELTILGRIHTYNQFLNNYNAAREVGFKNINIDLMSALPNQKISSYEQGLRKILDLNPEHISAYSLIIEENTKFYNNNKILDILPSEEEDREMYMLTKELLGQVGYSRYEISNYSKQDFQCKHNIVYWTGKEYLGLGLGASSYLQEERFSNTQNFNQYINTINLPYGLREEKHKLTQKEKMEEFMFLGLRLIEGIQYKRFKEKFGMNIEDIYGTIIDKYIKDAVFKYEKGCLSFTEKGLDCSNYILSDFILD